MHKRKLFEVEKEIQLKKEAGNKDVPHARYAQEYQMKVEPAPVQGNTVVAIQNPEIQDQPRYTWRIVDNDPSNKGVALLVPQQRDS